MSPELTLIDHLLEPDVLGWLVLAVVIAFAGYRDVCELRYQRARRRALRLVTVTPDPRIEQLPPWRLAVLNTGMRLMEWAERGRLAGDALIDRVRERWQLRPHRTARSQMARGPISTTAPDLCAAAHVGTGNSAESAADGHGPALTLVANRRG